MGQYKHKAQRKRSTIRSEEMGKKPRVGRVESRTDVVSESPSPRRWGQFADIHFLRFQKRTGTVGTWPRCTQSTRSLILEAITLFVDVAVKGEWKSRRTSNSLPSAIFSMMSSLSSAMRISFSVATTTIAKIWYFHGLLLWNSTSDLPDCLDRSPVQLLRE